MKFSLKRRCAIHAMWFSNWNIWWLCALSLVQFKPAPVKCSDSSVSWASFVFVSQLQTRAQKLCGSRLQWGLRPPAWNVKWESPRLCSLETGKPWRLVFPGYLHSCNSCGCGFLVAFKEVCCWICSPVSSVGNGLNPALVRGRAREEASERGWQCVRGGVCVCQCFRVACMCLCACAVMSNSWRPHGL